MALEVIPLLVTGVKNLTQTTCAKKKTFSHLLISQFRPAFKLFPIKGLDYCHKDLISLSLFLEPTLNQ